MDVSEIRDKDSLEAWLNSRPEMVRQADALAIALRAAMRVFPLWSSAMGAEWARTAELTALPIMRCYLTSGVAREFPTPFFRNAATASAFSFAAPSTASHLELANCGRANASARETVTAAGSENTAIAVSAAAEACQLSAAGFGLLPTSFSPTWHTVRSDAQQIEEGKDPFSFPLWSETMPDWFTAYDRLARAIWAKDPETWDYWIRWWEGILAGKPLDLEVQKAIALEIPDADWSDPEAVAAHIRRIEEREALRRENAALRTQLAASQEALVANPAHRGHNNPPEMINLPAEVREAGTEIAAQLEVVSEELAKPRQSSAVLRKAGSALVAGARTILLYCGHKADAVLDHALKPLGLALGTQAAAWLTGVTWEQVVAFGNALVEFAVKWPWP